MNSVPSHPLPRRPLGAPLGRFVLAVACLAASFTGGCCTFCSQVRNAAGVAYYRRGHHQAALGAFQRAQAADPANPDSYYNLAAAHHRLGKTTGRQEDLIRAEQLYNQCLDRDVNGTHRECYRALAVLLVEQDRSDAAERLLQGWADRNPSSAAARVELARLYREIGDSVAEQDALLAAVTLDPNDARAHAALGRLHDEAGETAAALANYERALAQNPLQRKLASRVAVLRASSPASMMAPMPGSPMLPGAPAASRLAERPGRSMRLN